MRVRASDNKQEKLPEARSATTRKFEDAGEQAVEDARVEEEAKEERRRESPKHARDLEMAGGHNRIITYQFQDVDVFEEYQELRASLRSKDGRASSLSYGELQDALDVACDNAQRGAELAARANVVHVDFLIDAESIESTLRLRATKTLEEAKAEWKAAHNTAGKQITNDDVKAEIMASAPDEWSVLQTKKAKAKEYCDLMESLAERLAEREKDLRQMVARSRAVE